MSTFLKHVLNHPLSESTNELSRKLSDCSPENEYDALIKSADSRLVQARAFLTHFEKLEKETEQIQRPPEERVSPVKNPYKKAGSYLMSNFSQGNVTKRHQYPRQSPVKKQKLTEADLLDKVRRMTEE